eukprot:1188587-Prorocentrum_minimum.AAC.3
MSEAILFNMSEHSRESVFAHLTESSEYDEREIKLLIISGKWSLVFPRGGVDFRQSTISV